VKTLSIVIVNWNTRTLLSNLLTSVFKYAPRADFEVVVVDNASADRSSEMVTAEFPSVKLLVNRANLGFATAVNRGIRESHGEYVLLLNSDLLVLEGAIDAQLAFMETNSTVAICGGLLLNGDGVPDNAYGRFPSARTVLAEILPYRIGKPNRISCDPVMNQTDAMPVDLVSGADLMARRSALDGIGLLDEQFFMYFEDADWCFRAKRLGWDVCYVPSVRYIHTGLASMIGLSSQRQQWLTSMGLFLRKNYHGAHFVAVWLLWQLLRAKAVIKFRTLRIMTSQ
jgi:N-acetylglucosaminyl-diphospho-decaprenol L-rhamnosyltransferase